MIRGRPIWTLIALWAIASFFGMVQGAPRVTLAWDANSEPDLSGYKLHYGTTSGAYTETIDVGNSTTATMPNLPSGSTYFFVVTAYNTERLESLPSNEASYTQPMPQAVSLIIQALEVPEVWGAASEVPVGDELISSYQPLPDGSFEFTVKGTIGQMVTIYESTDLQNWSAVGSMENLTGTLLITDRDAINRPHKFYSVTSEWDLGYLRAGVGN